MEEPKHRKVDLIEKGLHFVEGVALPTQLDPEAYKKRLLGVMARDRGIISDALKIKKRIL